MPAKPHMRLNSAATHIRQPEFHQATFFYKSFKSINGVIVKKSILPFDFVHRLAIITEY